MLNWRLRYALNGTWCMLQKVFMNEWTVRWEEQRCVTQKSSSAQIVIEVEGEYGAQSLVK
jgi:hypothetical protein